jgi:hypothetical protein
VLWNESIGSESRAITVPEGGADVEVNFLWDKKP